MTTRKSHIAHAAEWRLLSLLFERPHGGWRNEVAALAAEVHDRRLQRTAAAAANATEGEYLHWFGPGGAVSPRAVTYRPFQDPGQILANLAMWFDAFAFRPRREDPPDHIAVEIGFVGFLLLKEAYAAARGERDGARRLREARQRFIETHLAPLAANLHQRRATFGTSYPARCIEALVTRLGRRLVASAQQPAVPPPFEACAHCVGPAAGEVEPPLADL